MVRALLIAVADYPKDAGVDALSGPPNDIVLMRQVLLKRFGVAADNIVSLVDAQATHTAIAQAFADLARQVRPGDIVYVHYSGHGSTAADPAERRGDQTWVSYGARAPGFTGTDAYDVLDKEIAHWLQPLYERTPDVIFVSDSCHSATVSRGEKTGVRFAPSDVKPHPLLAKLSPVPPPTTGVRIGSSRDVESAVELDPRENLPCSDKTQCYGVFTWYWAKALQESQPGDSWNDVFRRTQTLVATVSAVNQKPQIEGAGDRAVFGGQGRPARAMVAVTSVDAGAGRATLDAGQLSGVTVGSTYARPAADGDQTAVQAGEAVLKVSAVTPLTAQAILLKGPLAAGDLLLEANHVFTAQPIRLFVTGDWAATTDAALVAQLKGGLLRARDQGPLAAFAIVEDKSKADWWIYLGRPKSPMAPTAETLPQACERAPCPAELWILSRTAGLMSPRLRHPVVDGDETVTWLVASLRKYAWAQEVKGLATQGNALPVSVSLTVHRPAPGTHAKECLPASVAAAAPPSTEIETVALGQASSARLHDCLSFTVVNNDSRKPWYAYVVAVGPDFSVQRIFPTKFQVDDEARLKPKETLSAANLYELGDVGTETLMLLVSPGPVQTITLEQAGVRGKGDASHLSRLLAARAERRGMVVDSTVETWGAMASDLKIGQP